MKKYLFLSLLLVFESVCGQSKDLSQESTFWQCNAIDSTSKQWQTQSSYKKLALNKALSLCKKDSIAPISCKVSGTMCDLFLNGVNTKPLWQCSALDSSAIMWPSNLYPQREDAALAAKDYCKQNSAFPHSCYINMISCHNKNSLF